MTAPAPQRNKPGPPVERPAVPGKRARSPRHATPGWYHDPRGLAGAHRWWDGAAWTDWLSADAAAPPPGISRRRVKPDPLLGPAGKRALLIAGVVFAALVLVLGLLIARGLTELSGPQQSAVPTDRPGTPKNDAPEISITYSDVNVKGVWGAELPSGWRLTNPTSSEDSGDPEPVEVPGMWSAVARGNYQPDNNPGVGAMYNIGIVAADVPGDNPEALAKELLAEVVERGPGLDDGKVLSASEPVVGPGRRAGSALAEQSFEVEYPKLGRATEQRRIQADILPDGTRVAWMSLTVVLEAAKDSPEVTAATDALEQSLDSTI